MVARTETVVSKDAASPPLPSPERLRRALQRQYARLALFPERPFHLHTGAPLAALSITLTNACVSTLNFSGGEGDAAMFGR